MAIGKKNDKRAFGTVVNKLKGFSKLDKKAADPVGKVRGVSLALPTFQTNVEQPIKT